MKLIFRIILFNPTYPKHYHFNIKILMKYFTLFWVLNRWNPVCIRPLQHISIGTSHVANQSHLWLMASILDSVCSSRT